MRNNFRFLLLPACLVLGLLTACGGGNDPAPVPGPSPVSSLSYTDPTGTGWRLVKDSSSTASRLVLNLVGPAGLKCRGVGFNLKGADGVAFATFDGTAFAKDKGVFELTNVAPDPLSPPPSPEPVLFASGVKPGNLLTVGIFQKDRRASAKDVNLPLVQVALSLDAAKSASLRSGDALALSVTKARIISEDIGDYATDSTTTLILKAQMADIQVAVGTLTVK